MAILFLLAQKRDALRREEEARKWREEEKKNALKLSSSYSEQHYESAMAKITKAAARCTIYLLDFSRFSIVIVDSTDGACIRRGL